MFQIVWTEVNKESPTVTLGDTNVLVKIDNLEKTRLFGQWKGNPRELPPLEKGIDNRTDDFSNYNSSVGSLGKGIGCWSVLE